MRSGHAVPADGTGDEPAATAARPPAANPRDLEARLSAELSDFARTLITDFSIQTILDHLVRRIVDVLPITAAGVTLISAGTEPHHVAASDASALRYVRLQDEIGEGPCVAAYSSGTAISVLDLREDDRFPRFSRLAVAAGLRAVFSFPLRDGERRLGALDLYRSTPGGLDAAAMAAAQTLADVTSAYLLNARARVELRASAENARRMSLHDGLTGLPNRTLLVERIERAAARSPRSGKHIAILFADLDMFKAVNDNFGHHIGDEVLVAVAARLTPLLRPSDTLARLGGDEFVILCEELDTPEQVQPVADRVTAALLEPFHVSGHVVHISASIGVAFAGRTEDMTEKILQDADAAMYQAKQQGGGRHAVLDRDRQQLVERRTQLRRDLQHAIDKGELRLDYQPIVSTADGEIAGAEALLRWAHPVHGLIAPDTIVPLAEQTGLMVPIGLWVLQQACRHRQRWPDAKGGGSVELAVNVSVVQLMHPGFVAAVADTCAATVTAPGSVVLEITESAFIDDAGRALAVFEDLKELGVQIALDDFGTGYSALSILKQFPIDIVKIDRQFIADIDHDPDSSVIVRSVVALAHGLNMTVVAEGIESHAQFEHVVASEVEACQGFYLARPVPPGDLDRILDCWAPILPNHGIASWSEAGAGAATGEVSGPGAVDGVASGTWDRGDAP